MDPINKITNNFKPVEKIQKIDLRNSKPFRTHVITSYLEYEFELVNDSFLSGLNMLEIADGTFGKVIKLRYRKFLLLY